MVGVQAGNVILAGAGQSFLRQHHFDVAGHPGGKAVLSLRHLLVGEIGCASDHLHRVAGGSRMQERSDVDGIPLLRTGQSLLLSHETHQWLAPGLHPGADR